jgi:hypothetical protein
LGRLSSERRALLEFVADQNYVFPVGKGPFEFMAKL